MCNEVYDDSEKVFWQGEARSGYVWCLHCERAYEKSAFVNNAIKTDWAGCLSFECTGAGWEIDIFSWSPDEWPRNVHPEYPDVPVPGKSYPLY